MEALLGLLCGILIVYFSYQSPGFKKFTLVALGIIGGLLGLIFIAIYTQTLVQQSKYEKSRNLIPPADLSLQATLGQSYGSWKMEGKITNNSKLALKSFVVKVQIQDCSEKCIVVGEESEFIYLEVPPGQQRAIDSFIRFINLPTLIPGKWSWTYSIQETVADID